MAFEFRCKNCKILLFKESVKEGLIEIKCPKCNTYSIIDREVTNKRDQKNQQSSKKL